MEGSLFWRPVTPKEVEELCRALVPHKGMGMGVVKGVARQILGPLSQLLYCCIRGGEGGFPSLNGGDPREFSNYRPV